MHLQRNIDWASSFLLVRGIVAFLFVFLAPLLFEKYTFYLYLVNSPDFGGYSGRRFWFDIGWFIFAGAVSGLIVGRKRLVSLAAPITGSAAFILAMYARPLCGPIECYVSSPDGLGSVRDFLFFTSLGVLACNAVLSSEGLHFQSRPRKFQIVFLFVLALLLSYALSFFPLVHLFAGVSVPPPLNYVQWLLASAVPSLAASFLMTERSRANGLRTRIATLVLAGLSGVFLGILLDFSIPCEACSGYPASIGSIILVSLAASIFGIMIGKRATPETKSRPIAIRKYSSLVMVVMIIGTTVLLIGFYYTVSYEASVVNPMGPGVTNTSFSPLEVGTTFVYSGGYLATTQYRPSGVGVSVNFGNSSISGDPSNFLAAGFGDQSPNCCTDGIDLAYRADAVMFTNGTEALLARTWWACDVNMACGGYSWQQLLHYGAYFLPKGTLSNWIDLRMNWTTPMLVGWYFRVHYGNGSVTQWLLYNSFKPPEIDNHYFDAGICCGDVLFYQFGISSARVIANNSWSVTMSCPTLIENGSWSCLQHASFISGENSLWKIVYTWGRSYNGLDYAYLGNYTTRFFYSTHSPKDGTIIW